MNRSISRRDAKMFAEANAAADAKLLEEARALDAQYAEAAAFDAAHYIEPPEEWCDAMSELHKAALNMGQP